jgi:hypothetical protein
MAHESAHAFPVRVHNGGSNQNGLSPIDQQFGMQNEKL